MTLTITCQPATRLIEERAEARLPLPTAVALAVHLWLCPYCKRYAAQSPLLAQLALFTAQHTLGANIGLPAAARARIQQRLDAAQGEGSGKAEQKPV